MLDDRQGVRQSGRPGPLMRYPRQSPVAAALCVNSHNLPGRDVLNLRSRAMARSALASGSTGSAGRGSDHKRYSVVARSGIKPWGLRRHVGAVPCGPGYLRYPQAGRDDSRFPRKGEIWPTRCPRLERSPFQKTQIVCEPVTSLMV